MIPSERGKPKQGRLKLKEYEGKRKEVNANGSEQCK